MSHCSLDTAQAFCLLFVGELIGNPNTFFYKKVFQELQVTVFYGV